VSIGFVNKNTHSVNIGHRLRELRLAKKLTQREMAEFSGLTQGHYANVESGTSGIKDAPIMLICSRLAVNFDWLKHGTGPMSLTRTERIREMREDRPFYGEPPQNWRARVIELMETDAAKIEYALKLGVPLTKVLHDLGQQVIDEQSDQHKGG